MNNVKGRQGMTLPFVELKVVTNTFMDKLSMINKDLFLYS